MNRKWRMQQATADLIEAAVRYARATRRGQYGPGPLNRLQEAARDYTAEADARCRICLSRSRAREADTCEVCARQASVRELPPWLARPCGYCGVEVAEYCRTSGDKVRRSPHHDRAFPNSREGEAA